MRNIICALLLFVASSLFAEAKWEEHILFREGQVTVGRIAIVNQDAINQATYLYVKNALDYYRKTKPAFIILELNTPGGEVFAAQRISDALKEIDTQDGIPVVAFVNNWAISAGAMLAYSCRFITVVKDASMGAAEPITMSGQETKTASEKVNSAIRTDFANRANFYGRNPAIAEAMVDKDITLVKREGKVIKIDGEPLASDTIIKAKGKLLTLTAEQMVSEGVADILLLPTKLEPITAQEQSSGKWPASKMLLFQAPFFNKMQSVMIDSFVPDWKVRFFAILANPIVASIIFLGMMLGFYIEMNTPGFGLPGTMGVVCLFLILLSSFALEAAGWLELIFLLAGIAVLGIELFVLPTFGLLGFVGILLFFAGLIGLMVPGVGAVGFEYNTGTWNAAGEYVMVRLAWLSGTFVLALILGVLLSRYVLPGITAYSRLILTGHEQEGYSAAGEEMKKLPPVGTKGHVAVTLRPSGKVVVDGVFYEAMSLGGFIEKETSVTVVRVVGYTLVVERT